MPFWNRLPLTLVLTAVIGTLVSAPLRAETPAPDESAAEAQRLFERAQAYVRNIEEGAYSYDYIQFYWKRAQANIDRIRRVYPETPTGRRVSSDEIQLGRYPFDYFRERVLPRLEEKRLAAYDAVNCAIFLYNRAPERWDAGRRAALASILEVLSRQQRWSEALIFPVLPEDETLRRVTIFRIAAYYDQADLIEELLANTREDVLPNLYPIMGEALVYLGKPREEVAAFLDEHPELVIRRAVFTAMVEREIRIQRAALLRLDIEQDGVQTTHFSLLNPTVRDDVEAVARTFFPNGDPVASLQLARYHAATGEKPAASADPLVHVAYLDFLADAERFDEFAGYLPSTNLSPEARRACEFAIIEFYARAGRLAASQAARQPFIAAGGDLDEHAAFVQFRGRMESIVDPMTVRPDTFVDLDITDPTLLVQSIMDWSLTPGRSIRGSSPWDPVVTKFWPGFDNLPLPASEEVGAAAAASPLY